MMQCASPLELGSPEYMARFTRRAIRDRVPLAGAFDITYRCNLRCVHCYAGEAAGQSACGSPELRTDQLLRLLAGAADAGCLHLLLSGGEPLLRADFVQIYTAGCRLGMMTTVFTNATLVTDEVVHAFIEYPPHQVEISLYGATPETYERVSGVPGSRERALRGITALQDAGVKVGLKTMILQDNLHEVQAIEAIAEGFGVKFRLDPLLTPRLDGDQAPLAQRVDPAAAAALEISTQERVDSIVRYRDRVMAADPTDALYRCGAGVMGFHVDPFGVMRPCLVSRDHGVDALHLGFAEAWRTIGEVVTESQGKSDPSCVDCDWRALCGYCPGLFALEEGSPARRSRYACGLGERRSATLRSKA